MSNKYQKKQNNCGKKPWIDKIVGQSPNAIEALKEILGLLRITKDNMSNRSTELATPETEEMSIAPAPVPAVYNENV